MELLSGQVLACDVSEGSKNDSQYIPDIQNHIQPKDLFLKDLGYFKADDLNLIAQKEALMMKEKQIMNLKHLQ